MKPIIGAIGLMMLFFVPSEEAMDASLLKAFGAWALCMGIGIALLAYAGAFKRPSKASKP
jgi:hypothetical protein